MAINGWHWKPRPDYTCLLSALRRQGDPGHIPFLELFADPEVIAAVLDEPMVPRQETGRAALERCLDQKLRFWYYLGYDALWQGPELELPGLLSLMSDDTASLAQDKRRWVDEKSGTITNWREFERYPWPGAADADLYPMEFVASHLPDGMAIVAEISGVLEPLMWLMGYETFALAIYDRPDLIEAMFDKIAEIFVPLARTLVQMDRVIALWMGDDMGFRTATMVAPDHLRRFVFPVQKQMAAIAHEQGIPFLLHSCGNLEAVMDDLIEDVGIDAKHSFEDAIQPVELFSAGYGSRVAVIGGVDVDILARGTEDQVRMRTRQILEACASSAGYVLGSGNSITNYIPPQNFLAMVDEGWKYNVVHNSGA